MANRKVVDSDKLDADIKTVADAIREKVGTTDELAFPDGMATAVSEIQSGGGEDRMKQYIEGTLTELYDADATSVAPYTFSERTFTKIDFPNVATLNSNAFRNTKIGEINLPNVTTVYNGAFYGLRNLKKLSLPKLVKPAQHIGYALYDLEILELPLYEKMNNAPNQGVVYTCSKLKFCDYGNCERLVRYEFKGFYSLIAVVIRRQDICSLSYTDSFTDAYHFHGTVNATYNPDGLKDGYIYVPRALVDSYKVATNWVTFADQFRALEDYTVDGTTTGEMDWDKINGGATV